MRTAKAAAILPRKYSISIAASQATLLLMHIDCGQGATDIGPPPPSIRIEYEVAAQRRL